MRHVPGQTLITSYFPLLSKIESIIASKDEIIDSLSSYCKELVAEREGERASRRENLSYLLEMLLSAAHENCQKKESGHGYRFGDEIKLFASYTFLTAGRRFYEFLHANAKDSLPSIASVEKYVAKNSMLMQEGKFYFK